MTRSICLFSIFFSKVAFAQETHSYQLFFEQLAPSILDGTSKVIDESNVIFHGAFTNQEEKLFLVEHVVRYMNLAAQFSPKIESELCNRKKINLHIYYVPRKIINNREVMHFLRWSKWDNKNIYGAFDSYSSPIGTVTIFLSSTHSKSDIDLTIKHEIYHYWQYRTCQTISEKPAYEFEKYHAIE